MEAATEPDESRGLGMLGWIALVATVCLGTAMRWVLAGHGVPLGPFHHARSAHVHLGYYGVVFPFVWLAWAKMGLKTPGRRRLWIYGAAVLASTVDFWIQGYALVSIVGSTVVLAAWIASAWPLRGFMIRRDWLAPVFVSVVGSALAIPVVAVWSVAGNPAVQDLVHTFLTWLLLGVAAPTALRRAGFDAPRPWLHVATVIGSGLALGILPHWGTASLLAIHGITYLWVALQHRGDAVPRVAWAMFGGGLAAVGLGVVPLLAPVAVAGIHFGLLGPVLTTGAWPEARREWRPLYLALTTASCTSIGVFPWFPYLWWPTLVAVLGTAVAAVWVTLGVERATGWWRARRA